MHLLKLTDLHQLPVQQGIWILLKAGNQIFHNKFMYLQRIDFPAKSDIASKYIGFFLSELLGMMM